jgi:2-amino-4-hydroxy-6-hydroxymethyldihydropteridine diphosphokinase
MDNRIFLLLGTNLGDRRTNLKNALGEIERSVGAVLMTSSIYQTAPWGKLDQPDFYNQVVEVKTSLGGVDLLEIILRIESMLGRERKEKWGERLIDIDILLIGDHIIQTDRLVIPHPQLANRKFTLTPLAEIAPNVVHPVFQKSIEELSIECKDSLPVHKLEQI